MYLGNGVCFQLSETPFKQERESLLAKVQTLLPRQEREDLDQFTQTLSLVVPSRPSLTPYLDHLLESAQEERWVAVIYRSEKGVSLQTLLPMRVRTEAGFWYCEAYSYERKAMRVYRVDRFLEVRATQPPPPAECPSSIIPNGHPSLPEVRIHLTARGVLRLEHEPHLGPRLQQMGEDGGLLRLRLRPEEYDWLVRVLLSLGTDAKVLTPAALRKHVRAEALTIARHSAQM